MANTQISEAKRMLLEKYFRGERLQAVQAGQTIPKQTSSDPIGLSFGQERVWFLSQLFPESPVFNECVTIHLPGLLDMPAFEKSFHEILRRHEEWRASFPLLAGHPVHNILEPECSSLPVLDLRHLPYEKREPEALRLMTEEGKIPFDLTDGPLLRATLIHLSDIEHRLFLTLHQLIFDGVALYHVFLPELHTLYEAYTHGVTSPLPEISLKYTDFVVWQRQWVEKEVLAKQLAYWEQQLKDAPDVLNLPVDHPHPSTRTYRGSMRTLALPKHLTEALKTLSRQEGVTLFMLLLAAFDTLLYRYSGQNDILIGTASAGRKYEEVQKLIGFFLNIIVLRTRVDGNITFRELLRRVREVVYSAFAHEDVPFEYVVKHLQPERVKGCNPLFQVMFVLEPALPVLPSGWSLTQMDIQTGITEIDLTLELDDRPEGLIGRFEYNTDVFDSTTIERMITHWQTLLENIVADPEQRISELTFLPCTERDLILDEWNNTRRDYPVDQCIHLLFEKQVKQTPAKIALIFEDMQLTYQELNQRANQLAHYLRASGVGTGSLVGLYMERSLEMIVGMLGILKAGGAYVPLDPTYPQERLMFLLQDTQAVFTLTQERLLGRIPQSTVGCIALDSDAEIIAQQPCHNPINMVTPADLAYIIYTSGSTGRPKGVEITHYNTVSFIQWACEVYSQEDFAGALAATSICFDLSIFEIFAPLSSGGTVLLIENVLQLPDTNFRQPVTLINTVPSAMASLLRNGLLPTSVRTVNLAGEPLSNVLAQKLYRQNSIQKVFNLYGPTETTTYATFSLIERGDQEISIGRPITNTTTYILDAWMQPVPVGVVGNLYIGGRGVARGYHDRPTETAECFVPHPFSTNVEALIYKTGDLARYRVDGTIEFWGRRDDQVKLHGCRIELEEIAGVLRRHPAVQDAFVVKQRTHLGDEQLSAYVLPTQKHPLHIKHIQGYLREKLPAYMVPSCFVLLDTLPRTPNGKIDRYTLSSLALETQEVEAPITPPTSTTQHLLVQLWEELLARQPIGIQDNFFHVGGHSFLAISLLHLINQRLGKNLTLAKFFDGPTIEQLASVIEQQENSVV